MKAIRIHSFGGSDQLKLDNIAIPSIGVTDVLVKVMAASINPVDWKIREGLYGEAEFPMTLGRDFSGIIEKVGEQIHTLKEGDEVIGITNGAYAEYVAIAADQLAYKPKSLDFVEAASVPLTALTAFQAVEKVRAEAGKRILIHGASGGVGSFAIQFAKRKGATVIAVAGAEHFEDLKNLGADELIDYHRDILKDKAGKVDGVIDLIGGKAQADSWEILNRGGYLVNLIGEIDLEKAEKAAVHAEAIRMQYDPELLGRIAEWIDSEGLKIHVSRVFPLDQAREAQELSQSGHAGGKVVLKVA